VKLLLDTHAALWWLSDDARIGANAVAQLVDDGNSVLLSAAVVWEVAIKTSLGKLAAPPAFAQTLVDAGALPLSVSIEHAERVAGLPWHHRDPFDRVLVAQSLVEGAVVVTHDSAIGDYGVPVVW
jgi:PIN domain nuclease of toxin-antitoxin system